MKVKIRTRDGAEIKNINRRKAIRWKCLDCNAWYYTETENCSITECKLYKFRTGKGKQDSSERTRAIRDYCLECMGGSNQEVGKCKSPLCPLFAYRQSKTDRSIEIKE